MSHPIENSPINLRELACLQRYGYHEAIAIQDPSQNTYWEHRCIRCKYKIAASKEDEPAIIVWNPNGTLNYFWWVWKDREQWPAGQGRGSARTREEALKLLENVHAYVC